MRKETVFKVVSGCAEGLELETMTVSCICLLGCDVKIWVNGHQIVCYLVKHSNFGDVPACL